MGADKALVDFAGAPMVTWCAAALAECAPVLVMSSSSEQHAERCAKAVVEAWPRFTVLRGVKVVTAIDGQAGQGPLRGFVAALSRAESDLVVLSACDTPLVPPTFYRKAVGLLAAFDAVAPHLDRPEPLISAWRRDRALALARELLPGGAGPSALLERLSARLVPREELGAWGMDDSRFASANTPEALSALLKIARA